MNYIKHLTGFFNKIADENKLNPTHISLYLALFQCWNVNRFKNPTGISREEIMKASKINSNATYHKCMKELQTLGFIEYLPTFNPHSSSNVNMINFSEEAKTKPKLEPLTYSNNEPVQKTTLSKNNKAIEQVNEQAYIYNNKQTYLNNINIDIGTNSNFLENEKLIFKENNLKSVEEKKEEMPQAFADTEKNQTENGRQKSSAKKEEMSLALADDNLQILKKIAESSENKNERQMKNLNSISPSLELTIEYFMFQSSTEIEANKFFNYYSSTGWLVGGKTKMRDWKAAARNWIMNQDKFKIKTPIAQLMPHNLNIANNKNYAEPL